jgi:hypothetical protein
VLGPEYVDASMARADEFMMSFQRATTALGLGLGVGRYNARPKDPQLDEPCDAHGP